MSDSTVSAPLPSSSVEQPAQQVSTRTEWLALNLAFSILLSAFLLFQVQPLISKFILPWFGGSPAVWTTCMLFFQAVLFCGYAYAHVTSVRLSARQQAIVHVTLLALACLLSPVSPDESWKPASDSEPTLRIFLLLASSVGLPYFALSSTGPLLQSWYGKAYPGRSPYRLYALSNFGSLVALVSYPFLFEPMLDAPSQAWLWRLGFALFAVTCSAAALARFRSAEPRHRLDPVEHAAPSWQLRAAWVLLPAGASVLLLAATNHICQDVAVIPFLWVAPLALYLLSFIVAFDHPRWYVRRGFALATVALAWIVGCLDPVEDLISATGFQPGFGSEVFVHLALVFSICMLCHGELVRLRPSSGRLTEFYLLISAGGALGGILVSLLAPALFDSFFEWSAGLVVALAYAAWVSYRSLCPTDPLGRRKLAIGFGGLALLGTVTIAVNQFQHDPDELETARNFYGIVGVFDVDRDDPAQRHRSLTHGITVHGRQFTAEDKRDWPLAYYGPYTGVGRAVLALDRPGMQVGVVGLGVGTLATYLKPGQTARFYEINPEVKRFAETYFSYLERSKGEVEVVMGDARLALEHEAPRGYHLLVLDAFSGDAVPAHLLTQEAFDLYARHLAADGALAINITNHKLDLAPVVLALAERHGMQPLRVTTGADGELLAYRADWIVLSREPATLRAVAAPPPSPFAAINAAGSPETVVSRADALTTRRLIWTDRYSNLFSVLK